MNAHSEDLGEKIVEALRRGMGKSEATRTFSVSLSSVKRYAKLAEEGRSHPRRDPAPSQSWTSEPASCSKRISRSIPFSLCSRGASTCEQLRLWTSVAPLCAEP